MEKKDRILSPLQKRLLSILRWYHQFCIAHRLRYYLLGGTMLRAARHEGFIPWDDDLDVGMPREDYEAFLRLTTGKMFHGFVVEGIHTSAMDFYYGYSKVYDSKTTLVENTRSGVKRGIYMDVFPLDGVAQQRRQIAAFYRPIFYSYQLLLARTCAVRPGRKWYKNMGIYVARAIPNFVLDNKRLMYRIDKMCRRRDYDSCAYVGNLYGNWGQWEIVERAVMGKPTLCSFEGLEVYGVEDRERYLTSLYGNWRQLPPKHRQITHHDYLMCDLERSYLEGDAK